MLRCAGDNQQPQPGHRRRHGWTSAVQPFAAAGAAADAHDDMNTATTAAAAGADTATLGQFASHSASRSGVLCCSYISCCFQ